MDQRQQMIAQQNAYILPIYTLTARRRAPYGRAPAGAPFPSALMPVAEGRSIGLARADVRLARPCLLENALRLQ